MNKNYFKALLFILSIFALIGCGNDQEPAHSHEFASEWSYNETTHYHLCNDDSCAEVSDSAAHTFGDWKEVLAPTCESSGAKERVCSVCKYKEQANVPALGHSYSEWEVKTPATREDDEIQHRICDVCDKEEEKVVENSKLIFYTVKFVDEDGTVLQETEVQQGHVPTFDEALPTKDSTLVYSYEFTGWNSEVVAATEDKVYTAVYTESYIKYTVTFKDADGTTLSTKGNYHYGDTVLVPFVAAKVEADKFYSFANWDQEVVTVVGDATYTAVYNEIDRVENGQLVWTDTTVRDSLLASDFFNAEHPADLSVVSIDGKNAVQVKYEEGFFDLEGTVKTTPGIKFANSNNLKLSEGSKVTFYVRTSDEWNLSNNHAGIYIFYDGEVCGVISASGKLWDSATAAGERDRNINQSVVSVMNIFANATVGDKKWVEVTISFDGVANPDLSNLSIAYGCTEMVACHGLLNTNADHSNSWIYVSDLTVVTHHKSETYTTDAEGHWHICTDAGCDLTFDYGTHEFGDWSTLTPAEGTTNEVKHRFCTVCNYEETKEVVESFEITFANYDGTTLGTVLVERGQLPTYTLSVPTKEASADYIYLFNGWDSEFEVVTAAKTYTAVFSEIAKTENGTLVWDEVNLNDSIIASDFYDGSHPAEVSVVTIDGKNALQVKYEKGFFGLADKTFNTPGIQFANSNKFKLSEDSTVTFYVRASDNWSALDNRAGIYIFYDGVECGKISANGSLWNTATAAKFKNGEVYVRGSLVPTLMQVFANGTKNECKWVEVTITFDGVANPDLSKLSIAYGCGRGEGYNGLASTVASQSNSWIYVSDLTVVTHHSSSDYTHDADGHWHACTVQGCDAKLDYATHTFSDWTVKTPATDDADEVQSRTCSVCGREETKNVAPTFEIKFVDYDGTLLQTVTVKRGEVPAYTLTTPTRDADLTYTYEFAGWDSELVAASEVKTYKAVYAETYVNYTIVFKDADGTELSKKTDYHYGDEVVIPQLLGEVSGDKFIEVSWDKNVVDVVANEVYQAVYNEVDRISEGQLVWNSNTVANSVVASDFYAGLHPADLSVVTIDGRNALQVKYEEGFFALTGTVKTTPGIQFANSNKFKLTQDSTVTFYVRTSEEWNCSANVAGIYIFYDGEVTGVISTSGKLWSGATDTGLRNRDIKKSTISVTNIFANGTIGDKQWVEVTISFDGIQNPDLSKLSIAYGTNEGSDFHGLLNIDTAKGQNNSWIYVSDLTVKTKQIISWSESNVSDYVVASDLRNGSHPADLSVVTIDGKNALQVKYEEGIFATSGVLSTPGVRFDSNDYELTEESVVKFYVRTSNEWSINNDHAGIYIYYDGEAYGNISASGVLWSGNADASTRTIYVNNGTATTVMAIRANAAVGDKQWVEVTITFDGIENPDLSNLVVAYGCRDFAAGHGVHTSIAGNDTCWIYISDVTIS